VAFTVDPDPVVVPVAPVVAAPVEEAVAAPVDEAVAAPVEEAVDEDVVDEGEFPDPTIITPC